MSGATLSVCGVDRPGPVFRPRSRHGDKTPKHRQAYKSFFRRTQHVEEKTFDSRIATGRKTFEIFREHRLCIELFRAAVTVRRRRRSVLCFVRRSALSQSLLQFATSVAIPIAMCSTPLCQRQLIKFGSHRISKQMPMSHQVSSHRYEG